MNLYNKHSLDAIAKEQGFIREYASTFPHTKALPLSIRGKECLR